MELLRLDINEINIIEEDNIMLKFNHSTLDSRIISNSIEIDYIKNIYIMYNNVMYKIHFEIINSYIINYMSSGKSIDISSIEIKPFKYALGINNYDKINIDINELVKNHQFNLVINEDYLLSIYSINKYHLRKEKLLKIKENISNDK